MAEPRLPRDVVLELQARGMPAIVSRSVRNQLRLLTDLLDRTVPQWQTNLTSAKLQLYAQDYELLLELIGIHPETDDYLLLLRAAQASDLYGLRRATYQAYGLGKQFYTNL